ncbi:endonuclease [candidate division KSB1 bacterium]|nr:MAG: endonuclease [candidate division KSB1 bacterium]
MARKVIKKNSAKTDRGTSRYSQIIEHIFLMRYKKGVNEVEFDRDDVRAACQKLNVDLVKNIGDLVYSFRYRATLPEKIRMRATVGKAWIIQPAGPAKYRFVLRTLTMIVPTKGLAETKVPDATPGLVGMYALNDEQGLLARVRYNRLIDLFTGVVCYSLQNHLRTAILNIGQVETDELYVGVDRKGAHYIFPVQAKGGTDKLSIVQIEQDLALCAAKFPTLICRPVAAQFIEDDLIALFEFEDSKEGAKISREKHYRLVPRGQLTKAELKAYRNRTED